MQKKDRGHKRKLIVISFLTLDGVMQAPGGSEEDREEGFKYGGWQMDFEDDDDTMSQNLSKAGALLLGRKTYDIFARYWPTEGKDIPFYGDLMNTITKYVASKSLKDLKWQNSNLLEGDFSEAISKIKKENGKDIYVIGSGNLAQSLMHHQLIDEYIFMVYPLVLGEGKHLFQQDSSMQNLKLTNSKTTKAGIVVLHYKVAK